MRFSPATPNSRRRPKSAPSSIRSTRGPTRTDVRPRPQLSTGASPVGAPVALLGHGRCAAGARRNRSCMPTGSPFRNLRVAGHRSNPCLDATIEPARGPPTPPRKAAPRAAAARAAPPPRRARPRPVEAGPDDAVAPLPDDDEVVGPTEALFEPEPLRHVRELTTPEQPDAVVEQNAVQ